MLLISRKGNPDGSLSNYPSLRILWPEGLFGSLSAAQPGGALPLFSSRLLPEPELQHTYFGGR